MAIFATLVRLLYIRHRNVALPRERWLTMLVVCICYGFVSQWLIDYLADLVFFRIKVWVDAGVLDSSVKLYRHIWGSAFSTRHLVLDNELKVM